MVRFMAGVPQTFIRTGVVHGASRSVPSMRRRPRHWQGVVHKKGVARVGKMSCGAAGGAFERGVDMLTCNLVSYTVWVLLGVTEYIYDIHAFPTSCPAPDINLEVLLRNVCGRPKGTTMSGEERGTLSCTKYGGKVLRPARLLKLLATCSQPRLRSHKHP
jgi:hypothetical protein